MTRPNSLPLLPPLGCAILFFSDYVCVFFVFWFLVFFCFFGFLVSCFLVRCWFFFVQWLNKTKIQKKNKKPRKNVWKNDKTQLSATTPPPWGVQSCYFSDFFLPFFFLFLICFLFFWFLGFLFSGSLLIFCAMAKQNQDPKKKQEATKKRLKKWQDPTLCHYSPPWGVQSCFFPIMFVFFVFWFLVFFCFFGFLVSCFLVRCWFFLCNG